MGRSPGRQQQNCRPTSDIDSQPPLLGDPRAPLTGPLFLALLTTPLPTAGVLTFPLLTEASLSAALLLAEPLFSATLLLAGALLAPALLLAEALLAAKLLLIDIVLAAALPLTLPGARAELLPSTLLIPLTLALATDATTALRARLALLLALTLSAATDRLRTPLRLLRLPPSQMTIEIRAGLLLRSIGALALLVGPREVFPLSIRHVALLHRVDRHVPGCALCVPATVAGAAPQA